jgi:predicted RNase H-like HicB family nuclease
MRRLKRKPAKRAAATQFVVVLERCEEGGYFAECPSLPGCHVEAETHEDVMSEIRGAITAYVKDLRAAGEPIPTDEVSVTSISVAV